MKNNFTRATEKYFANIIIDQTESPSEQFLQSITPAGNLNALEALMVYRGDYEARLTEALQYKYDGVFLLAGNDLFQDLARLYLSVEKSSFKDLKDFGDTFPKWLKDQAPLHPEMTYLYQIALIDQMFHHLFHIEAPTPINLLTDNAKTIYLNLGEHIQHADFTLPALTLWQHRNEEQLPEKFNWEKHEYTILIKNHHNQIDSFIIETEDLKNFWFNFCHPHSLLEALELTCAQRNFDQDRFIPQYTELLAWLTRHQLLRSQ